MTYQEQQVTALSIVMVMVFLVVAYFVSITVGLFMMTASTTEVETVHTYHPKAILLDEKLIPVVSNKPVPVKPKIDKDTLLLARIINAEAGNQPYKGKLAVGNVIMNRVASPKFPDTIRDVVYQRGQFSPVTDGSINKTPSKESIQAAKEVLNGRRVVGRRVVFFYNPDISTSKWIFSREVVAEIGDHAFAL